MAELNESDIEVADDGLVRNNETTEISELHSGDPISLLFVICGINFIKFVKLLLRFYSV